MSIEYIGPDQVRYFDDAPRWWGWEWGHKMAVPKCYAVPPCCITTPLVRESWNWMKEEPKMTDAQKDAIVKAAIESARVHNESFPGWTPEYKALLDAVRAAEQPAWSAGPPASPTTAIWLRTPSSHNAVGHVNDYGLAARIARLLNEDDAKGGK